MADGQREIWFRRTFLWGSTAVHWKGVVVLLVCAAAALTGHGLGERIHNRWVGAGLFLAALAWGFIVAERHTGPRR